MSAQQTWRARVWRRLRRDPSGVAGLLVVCLLLAVALAAPLLANDKPIIARYKGVTEFPAFASYVDSWVPWRSLRNGLKSWRIGDGFPLSGHYPALEGRPWKDVQAPDLEWAIWPPIAYDPNRFDGDSLRLQPGGDHLLGTDDQGRDVLSRLVHGTVLALLVGIVSQAIAGVIGVLLGLAAGVMGGRTDRVLGRVTEIVMCFPHFFLVIAVIAFLEPSVVNIMVVLGLVGWTRVFRLVRGEALRCRQETYVLAARAVGATPWRVMVRHVLPNAVSPAFVALAFGAAAAVLTETGLSFLGFGDPSAPSWGEILLQGRLYVGQGLWHLAVFPGLAIFVSLLGFNLLGQALRDAMDPRLLDR